ncbi:MAG: efflux RND transporter permease subunit [Breznakibacter sp.]
MSLTEIAIKRPTLVVVVFTVLGLLGISYYTKLNYDLIPKLSMNQISISTTYPGASANEVESSVTKVLEDALASLENVKSMSSTSQESASLISIELESDADADVAVNDAQRKINAILSSLPDNAETPSISKFSSDDMPVIKLSVSGNVEGTQLYDLVDDQIKSQLSKLKGIGQVSLIGGSRREIKIVVNKDKLDAYKLSVSNIYSAIEQANLEMPTGKIEGSSKQYTVRLVGKVKSLNDLRNITVSKTKEGKTIKISDLAQVVDGIADQDNINRINGKEAIGLSVTKQSDANTVEVCQKVKEQLAILENQYAGYGVHFEVASDSSNYILNSANAVMEDLMFAVVLVAFVMFIFLHSIRNSLIVMVSIPASIISVFIAMYVLDFSLNMLTLMALSLVVGILVDDSIVVLENIYRHLEMGKDRRIAALDGRNEIGFAAVAITLVDVVVFLPMSLVSGMIGNMLREFSLVVVFSTLMSLLVSFTITPVLASRLSKIEPLTGKTWMSRFALWFESFFEHLTHFYEQVLRWCLNYRKALYGIIFGLFIITFSLLGFGLIGVAFMNDGDRGEFMVKIEGDPQNTLNKTSDITRQVEDLLLKKPEVERVYSTIGYSSGDFSSTKEQYKTEITVSMVPKGKRTISVEDFAAQIKKETLAIPGIKVTSTPTSIMGSADDSPIQILLRGATIDKLYQASDEIIPLLKKIDGLNDIKLSVDKNKPELQISLDREKMEQLGLNVYQVGSVINMAFAGNTDLQYTDGDKEYDINIQFDQFDRNKTEDVNSLTFINDQGKVVELSDFATVTQALGPNKLERYSRTPSLTIKASVYGRPVGTAGNEVKNIIAQNIHPDDYSIEYKGQMERQADAFGGLFTALFAALIFVYLVMVALYNSYYYPFIVFFSIPVAIIGAMFALALTGESLTVFAMIGVIMLIGLVAKNAILIVDFANKLRETGLQTKEALIEAGKERLRPILMTTLSMIIGMLPIALASGDGAESKNGLAWVIIGGLTSSLLLTVVLVPAVYLSFEGIRNRFRKPKANPHVNNIER